MAKRISLLGNLELKLSSIVKATLKSKELSPKFINVTPGAGFLNTSLDDFVQINTYVFITYKANKRCVFSMVWVGNSYLKKRKRFSPL